MTPAQIARQEDIRHQRRMFREHRRRVPRWIKVTAFVVAFLLGEFALASWLMLGIGNGVIR